jgi:hypothetical protein
MNLDDEIKLLIADLSNPPEIIDEWEPIADFLSDTFEWAGSKIDWGKSINHSYHKLTSNKGVWPALVLAFINKHDLVCSSKEIFYINDSSLDFALRISAEQFNSTLILLINNVPQHHYFFDTEAKWCLSITSEGYVDFGFSNMTK